MIGANVARIVIYSTGKVVSVNALKAGWRQLHSFLASTLDTAVKFTPRPLYSQGEETMVPTEKEDGLAAKLVVLPVGDASVVQPTA
jgi:hypothetical protein